jgi:hypothetical protein
MVIRLSSGTEKTQGFKGNNNAKLAVHLTGAARSWLSMLPDDSIGSWGELED